MAEKWDPDEEGALGGTKRGKKRNCRIEGAGETKNLCCNGGSKRFEWKEENGAARAGVKIDQRGDSSPKN